MPAPHAGDRECHDDHSTTFAFKTICIYPIQPKLTTIDTSIAIRRPAMRAQPLLNAFIAFLCVNYTIQGPNFNADFTIAHVRRH